MLKTPNPSCSWFASGGMHAAQKCGIGVTLSTRGPGVTLSTRGPGLMPNQMMREQGHARPPGHTTANEGLDLVRTMVHTTTRPHYHKP